MTALTKELAKSPLKSVHGDRSSTALSYVFDNLKLEEDHTPLNGKEVTSKNDDQVPDIDGTKHEIIDCNTDEKQVDIKQNLTLNLEDGLTKTPTTGDNLTLNLSVEDGRPKAPTPGKAMNYHDNSQLNEVEHHSTTMSPARTGAINSTPSKASVYPTMIAKFADQDESQIEDDGNRPEVQSAPLERLVPAAELELGKYDP